MTVRVITGEAFAALRDMPDESVHCVVTSPPYWGLRSYGGDPGMIGLEETFEEHLEALVDLFREVRRVLRSAGTLWLNYGDAYAANRGYQVSPTGSAATACSSRSIPEYADMARRRIASDAPLLSEVEHVEAAE